MHAYNLKDLKRKREGSHYTYQEPLVKVQCSFTNAQSYLCTNFLEMKQTSNGGPEKF